MGDKLDTHTHTHIYTHILYIHTYTTRSVRACTQKGAETLDLAFRDAK